LRDLPRNPAIERAVRLMLAGGWDFWIDQRRHRSPTSSPPTNGTLAVHKLLSENPGRYADPAVAGIRICSTCRPTPDPFRAGIRSVRLGTTVATKRAARAHGEPTVLVITAGFADALRIAYPGPPRISDRQISGLSCCYSRVIEADERIGAHGEVIRRLDEAAVEHDLQAAYADGFRSVAVVCMHGYRYPDMNG